MKQKSNISQYSGKILVPTLYATLNSKNNFLFAIYGFFPTFKTIAEGNQRPQLMQRTLEPLGSRLWSRFLCRARLKV